MKNINFIKLIKGLVKLRQAGIRMGDWYTFGVLQSKAHELWARRQGTQLREVESGFRYTPTTCFETFPFPWPPGEEPVDDPGVVAVVRA